MSAIGSSSMVFPDNVTMSYHLSLDDSQTKVEYEVWFSVCSSAFRFAEETLNSASKVGQGSVGKLY